jgi:hypothetical protein
MECGVGSASFFGSVRFRYSTKTMRNLTMLSRSAETGLREVRDTVLDELFEC